MQLPDGQEVQYGQLHQRPMWRTQLLWLNNY
jgi:hypothetical protein